MNIIRSASFCMLAILLTFSSFKKTVHYSPNPLTSYFAPLQVGKYVTYRLDSLNFYFYGQLDTITSYLAKDSVEGSIIDAAGNVEWLVVRYLSDTTGANWTTNETYTVTASTQTIIMDEQNLRTIKLAFPLDNGFS